MGGGIYFAAHLGLIGDFLYFRLVNVCIIVSRSMKQKNTPSRLPAQKVISNQFNINLE